MSNDSHNSYDFQNILSLAGGLVLATLGVGLIMTHPKIRNTAMSGLKSALTESSSKSWSGGTGKQESGIFSDIQRYMKMRSM